MIRRKSLMILLTGLGFLLLGSQITLASSITLADILQPGATMTVGDKTFSDFAAVFTISGGGTAGPVDGSGITVTPVMASPTLMGLSFSGIMFAQATSPATESWDLVIRYDVTAAGAPISDVHLNFNGALSGTNIGSSFGEVVEMVDYGTGITQLQVTNPPPNFSQTIYLPAPVSSLSISKDISLVAYPNPGAAGFARVSISFVDQVYSEVPEPSSLLFLVSGMLVLGIFGIFLSRRRSQS
jgi:hypothetical protein